MTLRKLLMKVRKNCFVLLKSSMTIVFHVHAQGIVYVSILFLIVSLKGHYSFLFDLSINIPEPLMSFFVKFAVCS